ncbi:MAG: hypothetical protein GF353_21010 [Candidatus Lokiarchaeota archaeon]|nr:hypothetical protein [Candidatus Lokiarchaeota archaeon]
MFLMEFSLETQISGALTLIAVLFSIFLSSLVLIRAIKQNERILYLFFLTLLFAFTPWFPTAFGYLYWLFTRGELSYEFYIVLGLAFSPIGIVAWIDIYLTTIHPKIKRPLLIFYEIFSVIFEVYLIYFLFFAPNAPVESMLGTVNELRTNFSGFLLIYSLISVVIVCFSGIHFAVVSIKRGSKTETIWKGRFLSIGFTIFFVQLVLDSIIPSNFLAPVIILRILLIITIFFLYLGFILPNWMKKALSIE